MAFEGLSNRLQETIKKITGKGKVSEQDVNTMAREVRLALLEADVNFKVVKKFISDIKERAVGQEVMESLTPGQQVIKVVRDELAKLMGGEQSKIAVSERPPTVILMTGLQGAGKTTTTGKLANLLRKQYNKSPLLVACDIYRPAAIKQLETLGAQLNMPVFQKGIDISPIEITKQAIEYAKAEHHDYVLIDTAGRLHVDDDLMDELKEIKDDANLDEIFLDIYRTAAIKQLETLGAQLNMPVFQKGIDISPIEITKQAIEYAKAEHHDYVLIDTAGRLHVDDDLMDELKEIKDVANPDEIFLVVDSMTGQDAVNVAENFNNHLDITGVILTKLDGDTRGGAALSIKAITEKPIKFAGMGEKLDELEEFHPERMASRILGMGDVLTLIEKAQTSIDEEKAKQLEEKMRTMSFTFDDFLEQMSQVKQMGPLEDLLSMIPGANKMKGMKNVQFDEKQLVHVEAIIQSMTKEERQDPSLMNASRKKRIARGSGTNVSQVNRLLKQFNDMKKMMKQMTNMQKGKKGKGFQLPFM